MTLKSIASVNDSKFEMSPASTCIYIDKIIKQNWSEAIDHSGNLIICKISQIRTRLNEKLL